MPGSRIKLQDLWFYKWGNILQDLRMDMGLVFVLVWGNIFQKNLRGELTRLWREKSTRLKHQTSDRFHVCVVVDNRVVVS